MLRTLLVMLLATFSCRSAEQARPTLEAPSPVEEAVDVPGPHPLPLFDVSPEMVAEVTTYLSDRHGPGIEITESFGVRIGEVRKIYVAYQYQSFAYWTEALQLERFSRGGGEGTPRPPSELERIAWQDDVERCGLTDQLWDVLDERVGECVRETGRSDRQCSADEAEAVFSEIVYSPCPHDRVAVAVFTVEDMADSDPPFYVALRASRALDGLRCSPSSFFVPIELHGDEWPELLLEVTWDQFACGPPGEERADRQLLDLVILTADLVPELEQRLLTRELSPARPPEEGSVAEGSTRPEARYSFEGGGEGAAPTLVVERLTVPAACSLPPCTRFVLPALPEEEAAAAQAIERDPRYGFITRPCFPATTDPEALPCRPTLVDRTVLSYDGADGQWR